MTPIGTQYRQGDVFLEVVAALPPGLTPRPRDRGRIVLAYGEATGHAHVIDAPSDTDAIYDDPTGGFYLRFAGAVGLVHEEHSRIDLPALVYRGTIQREWSDAEEPIQVLD